MGSLLHDSHALETVFPLLRVSGEAKFLPRTWPWRLHLRRSQTSFCWQRRHLQWETIMSESCDHFWWLRLEIVIGKLSEVPTTFGSFMLGASRVICCCNCLVFSGGWSPQQPARNCQQHRGCWILSKVFVIEIGLSGQQDSTSNARDSSSFVHIHWIVPSFSLMQVISARADDGKNFGLALTSILLWPITGWSPEEKPMH